MKRYLLFLSVVTFTGLSMVGAQVESIKTGYHIRQLNIQKRQLLHEIQRSEYGIARLKAPERLESWIETANVRLENPKRVHFAKAIVDNQDTASLDPPPVRLVRLFVGTAQAEARD